KTRPFPFCEYHVIKPLKLYSCIGKHVVNGRKVRIFIPLTDQVLDEFPLQGRLGLVDGWSSACIGELGVLVQNNEIVRFGYGVIGTHSLSCFGNVSNISR